MPSSSSVRITRMAISPRFATSTFPNMRPEGYVLNSAAAPPISRWMDLLGRFSVLSLAATLVLGLVLAVTVRGQIKDRAIENAGQSALLIARFGIQPQLTDSDVSHGLDGKKIAALDEVLHDGYTTGSVKTIKVWNTSGTVIYSNDHKVIGDHDGKDEGFLAALRGAVHAEVSGGVDEEGESDEGRVLESYVPLAVGSDHDIDGVFELYSDYAPVAAGIRRDERRVFLL